MAGTRLIATSRRWWSAVWTVNEPKPNAECPLCGRPTVVAPTSGPRSMLGVPLHSPATRDERIASCATHGRPPFNNQTLRAIEVTNKPEGPSD